MLAADRPPLPSAHASLTDPSRIVAREIKRISKFKSSASPPPRREETGTEGGHSPSRDRYDLTVFHPRFAEIVASNGKPSASTAPTIWRTRTGRSSNHSPSILVREENRCLAITDFRSMIIGIFALTTIITYYRVPLLLNRRAKTNVSSAVICRKKFFWLTFTVER